MSAARTPHRRCAPRATPAAAPAAAAACSTSRRNRQSDAPRKSSPRGPTLRAVPPERRQAGPLRPVSTVPAFRSIPNTLNLRLTVRDPRRPTGDKVLACEDDATPREHDGRWPGDDARWRVVWDDADGWRRYAVYPCALRQTKGEGEGNRERDRETETERQRQREHPLQKLGWWLAG